jgi:hypothetical protein
VTDTAATRMSAEEQDFAVKTWRYLRLAMVVLVVGLGASIAYERWTADCTQTSISAYWYTPVQAYFVAAVVAIGVCLVCLRGSTDVEDILLNLAGMFAPVVAFVPTPNPSRCASKLEPAKISELSIENNVAALLIAGGFALAIFLLVTRLTRPALTKTALAGYVAAAATLVLATVVFLADQDWFVGHAHNVAAVVMFACILAAVCSNALGFGRAEARPRWQNPYGAIAVAMLVSAIGFGIAGWAGWRYWILAVEIALICLFAVFWIIQTVELWHRGLRTAGTA